MRGAVLSIAQLALVTALALAWAFGLLDWLVPGSGAVGIPYVFGVTKIYRGTSPEWEAELALVLGMGGTVIGLIVMVAAIDPGQIRELESAVQIVANALVGLGLALHTTLVGICVWVLLMVQYKALPKE